MSSIHIRKLNFITALIGYVIIVQFPLIAHGLGSCAGKYCGKTILQDGELTACGPCPCGYRPNTSGICQFCAAPLIAYDWLYLLCMSSIPLLLHIFFIDHFTRNSSYFVAIWYASAIIECLLSAVISIITSEPIGQLGLVSCGVKELSDWYTIFYNPTVDYKITLHCSQEAVCPLYSIMLKYYGVALAFMIIFRPLLSIKFKVYGIKESFYAALYFFPILIVVQAVLSGIIYFWYPYLILIITVLSTAYILASNKITTILDVLTRKRLISVILVHWLIQVYGIVAVTNGLVNPPVAAPVFLALIPIPLLFFIITVPYTNPYRSGLITNSEV